MTFVSRIRSLAVALAAILGLGATAGAQSPVARLGLMGGATVPVSDYGNDKHVGYHIGLLVDVRVPQSPLGFRIDGSFHELGYSGNSTKTDLWVTNVDVLLKIPTGTVLVPYAIGGAGFYNSHRTLILGAHSSTDLGASLGGGVRFELSDVTTFIEAKYHKVSGDAGIRIVPLTFGVLF